MGKEHEIHDKLKKAISEIYGQDLEGKIDGTQWVIKIKHGNFLVDISHPVGKNYIYIIYEFDLDIESKDILKNSIGGIAESIEFMHGLRSALTFPDIFYFIHTIKSENGYNVPIGFTVAITLFPFTSELSLYDLNKSIQNVVSVSALGISFLGLRLSSVKSFMEFLKELNSSPGDMYQ